MKKLLILLGLLIAPGAYAQSCPQQQINAQTGTTYTVLNSDNCKKVSFSNASAVAVTLPQAGSNSNFGNSWTATFVNLGAGAVTITPTTSTIDGLSSRVLQQYQGVQITSNGTNYVSSGLPPVFSTGLSYSAGTVTATGAVLRTYGAMFGDGSTVTATGIIGAVYVSTACTVNKWALGFTSFDTGSTTTSVANIWALQSNTAMPTVSNKITASAPPTVTAAAAAVSTTLTGWTTSIAAGSWVVFNLDSNDHGTLGTVQFFCQE